MYLHIFSYSELYIDNIPCDAFLTKLHKDHWEAKSEAQISQISVKKLQQHSDRIQSTSLNACKCAWFSVQLFGEVPISCQTTAEIDAGTASKVQVRETWCRTTGIVWDSPCPVYPELRWICVCRWPTNTSWLSLFNTGRWVLKLLIWVMPVIFHAKFVPRAGVCMCKVSWTVIVRREHRPSESTFSKWENLILLLQAVCRIL